jgi:hypothetical protein
MKCCEKLLSIAIDDKKKDCIETEGKKREESEESPELRV